MTTFGLLLIAVVMATINITQGSNPHATCEITYEKVGCFNDKKDRALPFELINDRDSTSKNYKGYLFKWTEYKQSIHSLACRCAAAAKEKGYKVFGLQFFGECWSGPGGESTFYKYNKASDDMCYQDISNPDKPHCDKAKEQECVGGIWTNYVYTFKKETPSIDTDGGYSKWSEWTKCSKTCGGGSKNRERTCTNPKPQGKGKGCLLHGPAEETKRCGKQVCPVPCTKALDVGIILDGSTSVTLPHFKVAVSFIKQLIKYFTVSPSGTHFGMIVYSKNANMEFKMSDSTLYDYKKLMARMDDIRYPQGSTYTDRALEMASNQLFTASGGDRPDKPNILIVFTDGRTSVNSKPYTQVLGPLRRKNVRVIAVGIGSEVDMIELKAIAIFDQRYVYHVDSFDDLTEKLTVILNDSCKGKDR